MILFAFEADGTKTREPCSPDIEWTYRNTEKHQCFFTNPDIQAVSAPPLHSTEKEHPLVVKIVLTLSPLSCHHALSYLFIITDSADVKPL